MTTIITRLYADSKTAQSVASALLEAGHATGNIDIIAKGEAGTLAARLKAARVTAQAAAAYASHIESGASLLVVRAGFNPVGAARHAIRTCNKFASINVGLASEDVYLREHAAPRLSGTVQTDHPYYMSNPYRRMTHSHILGSNPIIASRPRTSAIRGGAYMSKMFWPMKLISTKTATSAMSGTFLLSSLFGMPTIIKDLPSRTQFPTKV